jgi:flagellar hook-basal body complex protein FliE
MSIGPVGGVPPISGTASTAGPASTNSTVGAQAAGGGGFVDALARGVDQLQGLQSTADGLAVAAATGDLTDVHDYMIAATQAQLATELTVAVRNKALEAFTEIMRMPI